VGAGAAAEAAPHPGTPAMAADAGRFAVHARRNIGRNGPFSSSKSSPRTSCRRSALRSSVKSLAAQAGWSCATSFSSRDRRRVAADAHSAQVSHYQPFEPSWDARVPSGECHHIATAYRDTPAYAEAHVSCRHPRSVA
jgi:hypothetical protein